MGQKEKGYNGNLFIGKVKNYGKDINENRFTIAAL